GHVRVRNRQELRAVQSAVQSAQERSKRVHLQGHGHPHTEQRHALFVCVDGLTGRADRHFSPGGGPEAITRSCSVTATPTTTAISARAQREAKRGITWLWGRIGRGRLSLESRRCSGRARSNRWRGFAPSYSARTTSTM